ncbi:hypothetical protein [Knoellia sp. p5-6-4]|uniref:hypothetical protein n=1 Tax=unclassified Knoellia TaxID=2618719 RepID=UPI0023DB0612|nr:hypothetical protein [Knoellia sp. p5-6-4]MDF2146758.1 hypothetical protein [Knoellia sp. p5-6-4]
MAFRIPAECQDMARTADVRKWVRSKKFPRNEYFESIDLFRSELKKYDPDGEHYPHLAVMLARSIDVEGCLLTHVLEVGVEIADASKWDKICVAAAWAVLQEYQNALEKGDWP